MLSIFIWPFWALCAICLGLYFYTRAKLFTSDDPSFRHFQRAYLVVYLMAVSGDWLQGPHVYALYESYGMTKVRKTALMVCLTLVPKDLIAFQHQIEILFIAGFGSSVCFGTFVGSVADKYGRRNNAFVYGLLYAAACVTKHFGDFYILMIGRLLGGIATSILFSAFESWLVYEHHARGFNEDLLGTLFSQATLGNSVVAVVAGIVAQFAAENFGYVAPFDIAGAILIIMCVLIVFTWSENFGDSKAWVGKSFVEAFQVLKTDRKVVCLGLIQSCFEGSMYVFVLEWTPALTEAVKSGITAEADSSQQAAAIPHGYIFASFMVAIMIGSSLFKLLCQYTRVESFMRFVLLAAAITLYIPVLFPTWPLLIFTGFLVFEVSVGIFWPSLGFMRSIYVPEATRATLMNFFRVPLNLLVVGILLQDLQMKLIYQFCFMFLLLAAICQHFLFRLATTNNFQGGLLTTVELDSEIEISTATDLKATKPNLGSSKQVEV